MSHFSTLVICKSPSDIDDLLAKYNENMGVEPYIAETKAELIERAKEYRRQAELKKAVGAEENDWVNRFIDCKTDEELYNTIIEGDDEEDYDEEGNRLSTYNPLSKWDWYEIGGRWSDSLKNKDGELNDIVQLKDLDISPDKAAYDRAIRFWEIAVEDKPLNPGEEKPFIFYKKEYYTERYRDKYHYAKNQASFTTYALVTPDGEWHEKGQMGWFGMSSDTGEDEDKWVEGFADLIKSCDENYYAVMVDCHI